MSVLRHWKMILGLAAIFAAGMATGGVLALAGIVRIVKHQARPEIWVQARMAELGRRLHLTPEQKAKIQPLLESTVDRFHAIVNRGFGEFLETIGETHEKLNAVLTPEQQQEWGKMRGEAMKRWRDFAREEIKKAPPHKPL